MNITEQRKSKPRGWRGSKTDNWYTKDTRYGVRYMCAFCGFELLGMHDKHLKGCPKAPPPPPSLEERAHTALAAILGTDVNIHEIFLEAAAVECFLRPHKYEPHHVDAIREALIMIECNGEL